MTRLNLPLGPQPTRELTKVGMVKSHVRYLSVLNTTTGTLEYADLPLERVFDATNKAIELLSAPKDKSMLKKGMV